MAARRGTVLVVDDEAYVRDSLRQVLERRRFSVRTAADADEAQRRETLAGVDAVVTDLKLPGVDGLELVQRLARQHPELPVLVLTAHGTVPSAVECMRSGAFDYLLKPTDPDELEMVLDRALAQSSTRRELDYLRAGAGDPAAERGPLGVSPEWQEVIELVRVAAPADTSVLLQGESGTGKEEVAKLLHRHSRRAGGPFVRVNCAAIPSELFESEFFGHRRGAFTGAVADREGRFRVAHGGTLLLDEIDALPATAQAKVLRVLEDGTFERVGESRPTAVDVRLLCASNADLAQAVEEGRFRTDLFYRINVVTVKIPPLRQRPADIPVLAEAFLEEMRLRLGRPVLALRADTLEALCAYPWPGNVRELKNVIERGVLLETTGELRPESLPFSGAKGAAAAAPPPPASTELHLRRRLLAEEKRLLSTALARAGGVRRQAAGLLGIDERNLAYYLRKHGLMGDSRKDQEEDGR